MSPLTSILFVDDEPILRNSMQEILEEAGHQVVTCGGPIEALGILEKEDFAVVISDQRMPEMLGLDFLIASRRIRPHASRILITGDISLPTVIDAINRGEIFRFIAKPFQRTELMATVRNALQRYELITQNESLQSHTLQLNSLLTGVNSELETQVQNLEVRRQQLDAANSALEVRYENSLELCRRILTAYDPILGGETKALVEIANKMTQTEHFSDSERHSLRSAAWLADLGLIGISRELLRVFRATPTLLSERERVTLQKHPIDSQILAALVDSSTEVGETIRAHHEHFDGTGYPDGLAGEKIPWPARCLAVAVGFVESGQPKQATLNTILNQSGTFYDPEAVRLFLKVTHLVDLPRQVDEVMLKDLLPGMVLANGIFSPHGLLLFGEGQILSPATIAKIRNHNQTTPINQRLLVYARAQ